MYRNCIFLILIVYCASFSKVRSFELKQEIELRVVKNQVGEIERLMDDGWEENQGEFAQQQQMGKWIQGSNVPTRDGIGLFEVEEPVVLNEDDFTTVIFCSSVLGVFVVLLVISELIGIGLWFVDFAKIDYQKSYVFAGIDVITRSYIWLSIFWVPDSKKNFNRTQRLTVIYTIILSIFLSNTMTFGFKSEDDYQVVVAMAVSSVVAIPIPLLLSFLFQRTKQIGANPITEKVTSKAKKFGDYSRVTFHMDKLLNTIFVKLEMIPSFVLIIASIFVIIIFVIGYLVLVAGLDVIMALLVPWLGIRGVCYFTTLSLLILWGFSQEIVLEEKLNCFLKSDMGWSHSYLTAAQIALGSVILIVASFLAIGVMFISDMFSWGIIPLDATVGIILAVVFYLFMIFIWVIFLVLRPRKPNETHGEDDFEIASLIKDPWFPWYIRYVWYLIAWVFIAGMHFLIIWFGLRLQNYGNRDYWIYSSVFGVLQDILLVKPLFLFSQIVYRTAMKVFLERLIYRVELQTHQKIKDTYFSDESEDIEDPMVGRNIELVEKPVETKISIKRLFKSELLRSKYQHCLMEWTRSSSIENWTQIYLASRDGWDVNIKKLLSEYSKQGDLCFIFKSENGSIFGAFEPVVSKLENTPFLFTMYNYKHPKQEPFLMFQDDEEESCPHGLSETHFLEFGSGDLIISKNCKKNLKSRSKIGNIYQAQEHEDQEMDKILTGDRNFRISQIEILRSYVGEARGIE